MNPEMQFRRATDSTGLQMEEIPFCEMPDFRGQTQTYRLDLIRAEGESGANIPAVFFIHGGGFTQPCDKRQSYISLFSRDLTKAGYAVVSPDYPLFDDDAHRDEAGGEQAGCEKAADAIHRAYQFISEHADQYGLDRENLFVMGGSAGSMAAFYAIACYPEDCYRAFINCWGAPGSLPDVHCFPPTLSIHGDADQLVPFAREITFQEALEGAGVPHELIRLEGQGHTPLMRYPAFISRILEWLDTNRK